MFSLWFSNGSDLKAEKRLYLQMAVRPPYDGATRGQIPLIRSVFCVYKLYTTSYAIRYVKLMYVNY